MRFQTKAASEEVLREWKVGRDMWSTRGPWGWQELETFPAYRHTTHKLHHIEFTVFEIHNLNNVLKSQCTKLHMQAYLVTYTVFLLLG